MVTLERMINQDCQRAAAHAVTSIGFENKAELGCRISLITAEGVLKH